MENTKLIILKITEIEKTPIGIFIQERTHFLDNDLIILLDKIKEKLKEAQDVK